MKFAIKIIDLGIIIVRQILIKSAHLEASELATFQRRQCGHARIGVPKAPLGRRLAEHFGGRHCIVV